MNTIGIIGAMEQEVERIKEMMDVEEVLSGASMHFYKGTLNGRKVVVVRSGVCKVNAAVCVQILIDRFEVDAIINTGIAGSLDAGINIGDMVISQDTVHHDVNASVFGYEPGQIPQMDVYTFPADQKLIDAAREANAAANPDIGTFTGRIASGEYFVSSSEEKERINNTFGALCVEMEGAAMAQTAWLNKIPFVIIRAISDKADGSARMDYEEFETQAIAHSVGLVTKMMELL